MLASPARWIAQGLIISTLLTASAMAQSTWVGGGATDRWDYNVAGVYSNWSPALLPANNATVIFGNGFSSGNPNVFTTRSVGQLQINTTSAIDIRNGMIVLEPGPLTRTAGSSNVQTISAAIALKSQSVWNINGSGYLNITGEVTGNSYSVTKTGLGKLVFARNNTYSNGTTVSQGTLTINNTTQSATGSGAVVVQAGAILSGTGFIDGSGTTINTGAIVAPGDPTGTLTIRGPLTLQDGASINLKLGTPGTSLLRKTNGNFTISGSVLLNITDAGNMLGTNTYTLIDWTGATPVGLDLSDFVLNSSPAGGTLAIVGTTLQFTPRKIYYVKSSAPGANNGSSWTDAFTSLSSALTLAGAGDQIWVASGTYQPAPVPGNTPSSTFTIPDGVRIYGGFPGLPGQEANFNWRNFGANVSTLSGFYTANVRSHHVVTMNGVGAATVLDGFTISGGNAVFAPSLSVAFGGGIYGINNASPLIANCIITGNLAMQGAGANFAGGSPVLVNCVVSGNSAQQQNFSTGGGVRATNQCTLTLHNCTVASNTAGHTTGGVYSSGGTLNLINSIVWGNTAPLSPNIGQDTLANMNITFSDIQGGWSGAGNINIDPDFVSAPTNLMISDSSMCVQSGNKNLLPLDAGDMDGDGFTSDTIAYDVTHNDRITGNQVDMGAYAALNPITPERVETLTADCVGPTSIQLFWTPVTEPFGVRYNVYRSLTPNTWIGNATKVGDELSSTTFTDTSLSPGTRYYYQVTATDAGVESAPAVVEASTFTAPATPANVQATFIAPGRIDVSWTAQGSPTTGYNVYRGTDPNFIPSPATLIADNIAATLFSDMINVAPSTTYYYRVGSLSGACPSTLSSAVSVLTPPIAPGNLAASALSATSIRLTWNASPGATGYRLYRSLVAGFTPGPANLIQGNAIGTQFDDTGLADNRTYYYRAIAFSTGGDSPVSNEASATTPNVAGIIYVRASAALGGDGASWATAYRHIFDAIPVSEAGDQIWLARGSYPVNTITYIPTAIVTWLVPKSGVAMYGGFLGTETLLSQRPSDPDPFTIDDTTETVLQGLLPTTVKVRHVLRGANLDSNTIFDGLTIQNGSAGGSPVDGANAGGGLRISSGSPIVRKCVFKDNSGLVAGAIYVGAGSPIIEDCHFLANGAGGGGASGGATYITGTPTFNRCIFQGNGAGNNGGDAYIQVTSATFNECEFRSATAQLGGSILSLESNVTFNSCLFQNNRATGTSLGGAIYAYKGTTTLLNCRLLGNRSSGGGAIYNQGATVNVYGCVAAGNRSLSTSGAFLIHENGDDGTLPTTNVVNTTVAYNETANGGPVAFFNTGSVNIANSIFWGNFNVNGLSAISATTSTIADSIVEGGATGTHVLGSNPLFVAAASPGADGHFDGVNDTFGDLHVQPTSPAIDAGANASVPAALTQDLDKMPRFKDVPTVVDTGSGTAPIVDMGAYEAQGAPLTVLGWRSVRTHTGNVNLGIALNPTATGNGTSGPTVETRVGGIQRIEVTLTQPVTMANAGAITVTGRTTSGGVMGAPTNYSPISVVLSSPNVLAITFAPAQLPDTACYNIALGAGVFVQAITGDADVNVRSLYGDTTGNGEVALGDAIFTKSKLGAAVVDNAQFDINLSGGTINLGDAITTKSRVASPSFRALCP